MPGGGLPPPPQRGYQDEYPNHPQHPGGPALRKLVNLKRWFEFLARETTWNQLSQLAIADVDRLAEDLEARERRVAALEKRVAELGGLLAQATDELHKHSILIVRLCQVLPSASPLVGTEPASPQAIASLKTQLICPDGGGPQGPIYLDDRDADEGGLKNG